jgi:hypothetical protein
LLKFQRQRAIGKFIYLIILKFSDDFVELHHIIILEGFRQIGTGDKPLLLDFKNNVMQPACWCQCTNTMLPLVAKKLV